MPIANKVQICDACNAFGIIMEAKLICDYCKKGKLLKLPDELDSITINWPHCHDEFMSLERSGKCATCGHDIIEYFPKGRLPLDCLPGTYENRVFVGGNYDHMADLRNIKGTVHALDAGFIPILPYDDFQIPEHQIYEWDLRLLHNCKHAIFEVTAPAGELFEIARCVEYGVKTLFVYQARGFTEAPPRARTMLLQSGNHEHHSYRDTAHLKQIVREFLLEKSPVLWRQALDVLGYKFEEYEIYNRIYLNGNAEHRRSFNGLKVTIPNLQKTEMTHHIKITSGNIIAGSFKLDAPKDNVWLRDDAKSNDQVEAGVVMFKPSLNHTSPPMNYSLSFKTKDAYILEKRYLSRLSPDAMDDPLLAAGNEYASFDVPYPLEILKLYVEFPDGYTVNPKPVVYFGIEQCSDGLKTPPDSFNFDGKVASLEVHRPHIHYRYGIAWEIP